MLFNYGKCKCLHTGPGNTGMNYEMGGTILSKTVNPRIFSAARVLLDNEVGIGFACH